MLNRLNFQYDFLNFFADLREKVAIFVQPHLKNHIYALQYNSECIEIKTLANFTVDIDLEWHKDVLLPKIVKWMSNYVGSHNSSIALVPIDQYKTLYTTIKKKYSSSIRQVNNVYSFIVFNYVI